MAVIACLIVEPKESVCAACARLTPVVEPQSDRIFMDWTGCGPVPDLARRLYEQLRALSDGDSVGGDRPGNGPFEADGSAPSYRLGVAPLRFVAELLAQDEGLAVDGNTAFAEKPSLRPAGTRPRAPKKTSARPEPVPVIGGWYVPPAATADFISAAPVNRLPKVDEKTQQALTALAVRTLGDLRRIRIGLLRNHIGDAADKLLAWARGMDPRPVAPMYPPERLSRRMAGEHLADALLAADPARLSSLIDEAATPLLHRLQGTGRAAAHLAVHRGTDRRVRTFAEPTADPDQILRAVHTLTRQVLAERSGVRSGAEPGPENDARSTAEVIDGGDFETQFFAWHDAVARGDLVIEIVPAPSAVRQMTLWDGGRPRNARQRRLQKVLDSLRERFGDVIGPPATREAVARYEAMLHLYGSKG